MGNNGGSQSIIRMAIELHNLGNDVKILLDGSNRFDWFGGFDYLLKYIDSNIDEIYWPKCDVIIATGCGTVKSTLYYPHVGLNNKFYWIRGHETWAMSEDDLFKNYKSGLNLLVNSEWLKEMIFKRCGVGSKIQYPGYISIDNYEILTIYNERINLGALYYADKLTKRFDQVVNIAIELKKIKMINKLILFGNKPITSYYVENLVVNNIPYKFLLKPTYEEKIKLMKECNIWLATTELEGLHIPPIEAGLCGCNLVVKGLYSSGINDYAIDNVTAKTFLTTDEAIKKIVEYKNNHSEMDLHKKNLLYILHNKIGDVEENALKLQNILKLSLE